MSASNTLPIYHVFISVNEQLHHKDIYDMLELYKSGKITKETYVWKIDMEKKWVQAGNAPDLKAIFAMPPLPEDTPKLKKKILDDLEDDRFEQRLNAKK